MDPPSLKGPLWSFFIRQISSSSQWTLHHSKNHFVHSSYDKFRPRPYVHSITQSTTLILHFQYDKFRPRPNGPSITQRTTLVLLHTTNFVLVPMDPPSLKGPLWSFFIRQISSSSQWTLH